MRPTTRITARSPKPAYPAADTRSRIRPQTSAKLTTTAPNAVIAAASPLSERLASFERRVVGRTWRVAGS